jgi:hypothetical protein
VQSMLKPTKGADFEFLSTLDAGNHLSHPTGTVEEYEAEWWTKDQAVADDHTLTFEHLPSCLSFHRQVRKQKDESVTSGIPTGTGTDHTTGTGTDGPTGSRFQMPDPIMELDCSSCRLYRSVAMDAIYKMGNVWGQCQQKESASQEHSSLQMWHASGFNKLFEAAILKETQSLSPNISAPLASAPEIPSSPESEPIAAPKSSSRQLHAQNVGKKTKARRIQAKKMTNQQLAKVVHRNAQVQYDSLKRQPSLKWTWGADLDREDIRRLFRAADRSYELPHSDYDYSLKPGRFSGEDSPYGTMPRPGSGIHSIIPDQKLPYLDTDEFPIHFHEFPLWRQRSVILAGELPIGGEFPYLFIKIPDHPSPDGRVIGAVGELSPLAVLVALGSSPEWVSPSMAEGLSLDDKKPDKVAACDALMSYSSANLSPAAAARALVSDSDSESATHAGASPSPAAAAARALISDYNSESSSADAGSPLSPAAAGLAALRRPATSSSSESEHADDDYLAAALSALRSHDLDESMEPATTNRGSPTSMALNALFSEGFNESMSPARSIDDFGTPSCSTARRPWRGEDFASFPDPQE